MPPSHTGVLLPPLMCYVLYPAALSPADFSHRYLPGPAPPKGFGLNNSRGREKRKRRSLFSGILSNQETIQSPQLRSHSLAPQFSSWLSQQHSLQPFSSPASPCPAALPLSSVLGSPHRHDFRCCRAAGSCSGPFFPRLSPPPSLFFLSH